MRRRCFCHCQPEHIFLLHSDTLTQAVSQHSITLWPGVYLILNTYKEIAMVKFKNVKRTISTASAAIAVIAIVTTSNSVLANDVMGVADTMLHGDHGSNVHRYVSKILGLRPEVNGFVHWIQQHYVYVSDIPSVLTRQRYVFGFN